MVFARVYLLPESHIASSIIPTSILTNFISTELLLFNKYFVISFFFFLVHAKYHHSMTTYKIKLLTVLLVYNSILFHTIRCKYYIQYSNYQKYNYYARITVYTPL